MASTLATERRVDLDATYDAMVGMRFTCDGVAGTIQRDPDYGIKHVASAAGKRSEIYRRVRARLGGDDYHTAWELIPEALLAKADREGRIVYEEA